MRLLAALLIFFTGVVVLGGWTNHKLETSTGELLKIIDSLAGAVEKKDWDQAGKETARLEKSWEEKAGWWPVLLDHQEMDNIEFSLARIKEYVSAHDLALSRGQLSELREMVRHIPEKEAVTLKNIL
ncbi:MAG: hypothetical protein JL50_18950 [Peptococcaceae bacterium BICA1-7]|nr:MAG: hypothetical protein JL50_18950 [Peptococcaceae bacterium BICA1-7]HBV98983.1 DUF4363 domain-containing protein [Desulfotomaculum sp.]